MEKKQFSNEELSVFCLGLAHLIRAGLTSGDAMALMAQDEADQGRKALYEDISLRCDEGAGLAQALRHEAFPVYVHTMLAAGEETGRIEEALFALSDYYDGRARLTRSLRAALFHPLLLLGVLLVVIVALLGWVLPVFDDVYRQLGSSLTGIAGGLLLLGNVLRAGAPVLGVLAVAVCAAGIWLSRSKKGQERLFALMGSRFAQTDAARLTQILAMALGSGLDGERAVELAAEMGDEAYQKKCGDCLDRLRGQETLPQALRSSGLLPGADCRLLEAGYRAGSLDSVMAQLSRRVQERSQAQIESWLGRIEPALVLTASILVGLVLLSVLLPLTRIMASIG